MSLCLRAGVVLIALAAPAAAADQYLPGPAPTVGPLKHLTEAEAAIGSPRDRLEFGLFERVTFWIDRQSWNDVDLMRPAESARWREVPDEMGIAIWSVDGSCDIYPTVGDETTLTVSGSGKLRLAAAVADSGQRGKDKKTTAPIELAAQMRGRPHFASRSMAGDLLRLAGIFCLLEAEEKPVEKTLTQLLFDVEERLKRGRETNLDQVEREGRQLLAHHEDAESQALIYYRLAKIAAESGQILPSKTIEFAEAALKHPLRQDLRVRALVYWGDALQVLDYGEFPQRRPEAADVYLKALAAVLEFKPLPVKDEPAHKGRGAEISGGETDPNDPDGRKAFDAAMANSEARRLNENMQRNRKVVVAQLVSLYGRQPAAAELEGRAKAAIADPEAVRQLMDELHKARPRKAPVGEAKGNP